MSLPASVKRACNFSLSVAGRLSWLPPLVVRLAVGVLFLRTGWAKLHHLDDITEYFASLHIPSPHANAVLAGTTEFVAGISLCVGLLTRLAALPLMVTMGVAIVTAKWADVDSLNAFLGLEEFLLILLLGWLVIAGAGALSLDRLLARRWGLRGSPHAGS